MPCSCSSRERIGEGGIMRSGRRIGVAVGVLVVLADRGRRGLVVSAHARGARARASRKSRPSSPTATIAGRAACAKRCSSSRPPRSRRPFPSRRRRIVLETALPPIITAHGREDRLGRAAAGVQIDATALKSTAGAGRRRRRTPRIEGVTIRNCSGTAILLRAERFRLTGERDRGLRRRHRYCRERVARRCSSATGSRAIAWACGLPRPRATRPW